MSAGKERKRGEKRTSLILTQHLIKILGGVEDPSSLFSQLYSLVFLHAKKSAGCCFWMAKHCLPPLIYYVNIRIYSRNVHSVLRASPSSEGKPQESSRKNDKRARLVTFAKSIIPTYVVYFICIDKAQWINKNHYRCAHGTKPNNV